MVTVILSAYNAEKYIEKCIDSVINQTYKDFEFLIIEDMSTDGTLAIIERKASEDSRIRLIKKEKNNGFKGYVENLNRMIKEAKGEFIAKFDADDVWVETKLEKQLADIQSDSEIFLLSANAFRIDENGEVKGEVIRPHDPEESAKMLLHSNPFCHPSIFFRNEGYLYRPNMYYTEEYDLYLRLFSDGKKLVHRKDFLFYYRILESSMSRGNNTLVQALFKEKAIEFYHQRVRWGKDEYESFEPNDYLQILDLNYSNAKNDLEKALKLAFIAELEDDFKILIKKAVKQFGIMSFLKFWFISKNFKLAHTVYSSKNAS